MSSVVTVKVDDLAKAAEYYESLLAVTPVAGGCSCCCSAGKLVGDHMQINLTAGKVESAATTLNVTSGMVARVLDTAMRAHCQISVESPERVRLVDQYNQQWTLQCRLS